MIRALIAGALLAAAPAAATIPSCYASTRIEARPPAPLRQLFVLIDQTTPIDAPLKQAIRDSVGPLLAPGTGFSIASFSAFAQGRYQTPLAAGQLERTVPVNARDDLSVNRLAALDRCLANQLAFGRRVAAQAIDQAVAGQSSALAHSDVVSSLTDLARAVKEAPRGAKIVIVVSDMLENSGLTSFYQRRAIRRIDPRKELRDVADKGFLGDFGGARVYVIGAGALPGADSYRDPVSMKALEIFWDGWFRSSKATLVDFGKPMPTRPVR